MADTNVATSKPPRRIRRKLDKPATLDKYVRRIKSLPDESFEEIKDAWLSTFDVYGSLECPFDDYVPPRMVCNATHLAMEARSRGVNVLGVTSQRKKRGAFICDPLPGDVARSDARVVYVGQFSYFTSNKAHPVFSILRCDRVLEPRKPVPEPEPATTT